MTLTALKVADVCVRLGNECSKYKLIKEMLVKKALKGSVRILRISYLGPSKIMIKMTILPMRK